MLTVDDANTLLEKYKDAGFWYCVDLSKINQTQGAVTEYDFCKITVVSSPGEYLGRINITIKNSLWTGAYYPGDSSGGIAWGYTLEPTGEPDEYTVAVYEDFALWLYITPNPVSEFLLTNIIYEGGFLPISPTIIPKIKGEYNEIFYVQTTPYLNYITIDGEEVTIEEDAQRRQFIRIPSHDCVLGYNGTSEEDTDLYYVSFREFKSIPEMSVTKLYRGTSQRIEIIVPVTEPEPVLNFQAYYQGKKLKDNIITLPYDAPEYIDITVDLLEDAYPKTTVKLKVKTEAYVAINQQQVVAGINKGIQTMIIRDMENPNTVIPLSNLTLNDVTLIFSNIKATNCTFNNVTFKESTTFHNDTGNIVNDSVFEGAIIRSVEWDTSLICNNCDFVACMFARGVQLQLTSGTLTRTTIGENSLIISDGEVEITKCIFRSYPDPKSYFPRFLYLTGDYTVTDCTFNLTDSFEELAFSMCIIKTTNDFKPSTFINHNRFNIDIEYEDEPTNTFYYNIVDDDKIKAVRL